MKVHKFLAENYTLEKDYKYNILLTEKKKKSHILKY